MHCFVAFSFYCLHLLDTLSKQSSLVLEKSSKEKALLATPI